MNKKRSLSELNVLDNFLFNELLNDNDCNQEFCRIVLSTILNRDFKNIKVTPQKQLTGTLSSNHGIRLDAYIEADEYVENSLLSDNTPLKVQSGIYDIEPNIYIEKNEARRTRYYHSLIDAQILEKNESYKALKNVFIIMILPYDPFGKNRMIYTMKTSCIEDLSIPYEDGSTTIYLYTKGTEGNPSQELQNMLHYMEQSNIDHVTDNTLKTMHEFVETVKHNKEVMKRYMKSWEYEEMIREEATREGLAEGRARGIAEGKAEKSLEIAKNLLGLLDIETIAEKTGLPIDEVRKLGTN